MSAIILFTLSIWVLSAVIRNADQKRQAARIAQVKAEQARQREELKRQREESKRQARQLDKHEAWLKKHDAEIEALQFKVGKAESDIVRLKEKINELYALLDIEENKLSACANGSNEQVKHQKKVITYRDQIHTAEQRLNKAQFEKDCAERKLEEVA